MLRMQWGLTSFLIFHLFNMYALQYDLQTPYIPHRNVIDYEHVPYTKYSTADIPNYSIYRPLDRYDKWPGWYKAYSHMPEFRHYLNNTLMRDCGNMLGLQYEPRYGILDYSRYVSIDIPKYKMDKPLDYYDKWPSYYQVLTPIPEFRTYLNNLLLRDLRTMPISLENRYDPIQGYNYTYWPDSKYFRNYRFSPPISWSDDWSKRSRVWFPYYWSTNRLFQHYMDYRPSGRSLREQRKTIYVDYPQPIRAVDYSYYPYSYRSYRPLTLYYNYYWPLSSLNRYSDSWPYYPYYRYLYYKYTLPSDRYYYLKGNMLSVDEPIREYRVHPRAEYLRRKVYKPLSLYCDYYYPIRGLFNSPYWPMYRNLSDFAEFCRDGSGTRLQRIFDDETRLIRAQTASLLRRVHDPVPRIQRYSWPLAITSTPYQKTLSARLGNDNYIHRLLMTSPKNPRVEFTTYYSEPVRKYIGGGHLSCITYAGERAHNRRPYTYLYEDPVRSDIQLLSYYINKFKQDKAIAAPATTDKAALNPNRPTRKFTAQKPENDAETDKEMQKLREARAARLAFIEAEGKSERASADVEDAVRAKKAKEAERLAEEQALAEEQSRKQALAKKEEAAKRAELARQEELAAQAAAERAAEIERQAELARQEELAKQAEIEEARQQEEERQRLEEQRRLDEETRAEEERKQLLRLEEIARQAEEEKEAELARQADELAELARQEAELAEQARVQAEAEEQSRIEAEAAEQSRLEAELAELVRKEQELSEQAIQEAEAAERAREEAEASKSAAEEELEEMERQQAELDALEAEAKALEADSAPVEEEIDTEEQPDAQEDQPVIEEEDPVVEEPEELVAEEEEPVADEEEDEDARRQREMDELVQQRFEQAQMEGLVTGNDDDDDEPAIAEDTPEQSDTEE